MSETKTITLALLLTTCLAGAAIAQETEAEAEESIAVAPVVEVLFGTDVDRDTRALIGEAAVFGTELERVWCLTRIQGMTPPATVTHAWYYEGKTMARVDLKVGSPDWRTWSSKRYLPAWTGHWEVKVLDEAGKVLASGSFTIE